MSTTEDPKYRYFAVLDGPNGDSLCDSLKPGHVGPMYDVELTLLYGLKIYDYDPMVLKFEAAITGVVRSKELLCYTVTAWIRRTGDWVTFTYDSHSRRGKIISVSTTQPE